jgi:Uncharacterized conserved protein (DUF2304)
MSLQGVILIDILAIGLLLLTLNLIRLHKLYVGYGVLWTLALCILMFIVSVPPLLELVTKAVGALFPASAVSLLAFVFIFVVLIFFSVQLSIISARQVDLIQSLALKELLTEEDRGTKEMRS